MINTKIKNNTIIHKDKSLTRLDLSFVKHIELEEYKKCDLLAYWIHDFAIYHDEEKVFDYSKSGVFSRGDVVKVNLGFNIGHELGGLHYCVVLNKYDNTRNGTLNVVPLTSKKQDKKYNSQAVNLGNELYTILSYNLEKENTKLNELLEELSKLEEISESIQTVVENKKKYIEKLEKEILKMKTDSIALINQITTISKQRIYKDPIIRKVKLSNNSLDLIDKQIITYFTK